MRISETLSTRPHLIVGALAAMFLVGLQAVQASPWNYRGISKISWQEYDASTYEQAKLTGKPLYVFIYADWCKWCKKFETETLELNDIRNLLSKEMIPVAIDYDKHPDLAAQLGAKLVPTNIVLTSEGKKLLRFHGYLSAKEFTEALQRTLVAWKKGELPLEDFGNESTCCPVPKASAL